MLKPSDRPRLWRRISRPALPEQEGKVLMGFDTRLSIGYDFQQLGWKYDALECGAPGLNPYLDCDPQAPEQPTLLQQLLNTVYGNSFLPHLLKPPALSVLAPPTWQELENRKIYNTHTYSHGNAGHEFTAVLTDPERRALIEYLKTL